VTASDTTLISLDGTSAVRQRFFPSSGTGNFNWQIAAQTNVNNGFEITPSSASGGSTFSTPAITVKSDGKVGIGVTSPGNLLHLSTAGASYLQIQNTTAANSVYFGNSSGNGIIQVDGANSLNISTNGSERCRVDSSGRLLVNTSTSPSVGVPASALFVVQGYTGVPTGDSLISLQRGQAPASITSGAQLGAISFGANDGSPYAQIHAATDGAGAANDYPGRLVLSTTADGGSSPTERMRIDSSGRVGIGTSTVSRSLHIAQAKSTAYSSSDFEQDYQILRLNNTTDDGSVGLEFQVGTNGQAAITADEVTDGNTDICFGTRGSGARTEKVRITAGGLVGIGSNAPSGRLDVETASDTYVNFSTTNNGSAAGICLLGNNNDEFFGYANSLRFATVTGKNAAGFNERMRMDSSGRLLVGTSSSTGLLSNTAPVIAGLFKSFDDAATFTTGVAQTLFTIPNTDATYIITLRRGAVGDVTNYQAVSILSANATPGGSVTTVLTALKTAGNVSISISGTNLQGTQTSGGAASLQWVVTRVG
jgi:hypothetical protein